VSDRFIVVCYYDACELNKLVNEKRLEVFRIRLDNIAARFRKSTQVSRTLSRNHA